MRIHWIGCKVGAQDGRARAGRQGAGLERRRRRTQSAVGAHKRDEQALRVFVHSVVVVGQLDVARPRRVSADQAGDVIAVADVIPRKAAADLREAPANDGLSVGLKRRGKDGIVRIHLGVEIGRRQARDAARRRSVARS